MTQFVSQFFDMEKALNEFTWVLKMGGRVGKFFNLILKMMRITLSGKVIWNRFKKLDQAKRILIGVPLVKTATPKHVGYILGVGSKN